MVAGHEEECVCEFHVYRTWVRGLDLTAPYFGGDAWDCSLWRHSLFAPVPRVSWRLENARLSAYFQPSGMLGTWTLEYQDGDQSVLQQGHTLRSLMRATLAR